MKRFKVVLLSILLSFTLVNSPQTHAWEWWDNLSDTEQTVGILGVLGAIVGGFLWLGSDDGDKSSKSSTDKSNTSSSVEPKSIEGTIKLMMIGDSITRARGGTGDVRCMLWGKLQGLSDVTFDFVGGQSGLLGNTGSENCDNDHEAHWGGKSAEVLDAMKSSVPANKPGMALIHIGTNDLRGGGDAISGITQMIDLLVQNNPDVIIFLAKVIPNYKDQNHDATAKLNEAIAQLVESKSNSANPVILVDQFSGFGESDLADSIHPNNSGAEKMATKWFDAIKSYLGK